MANQPLPAEKPQKKALTRDVNRLGNSFIFPPHVIDDIHIKAELGRYRMRGFSLFKKIPHWDDLTFLPGTLTRFVIEGYREKCETKTVIGPKAKRPLELDIPVYITGMSFGALSYEAKTALARGATMAGTATCSGAWVPPWHPRPTSRARSPRRSITRHPRRRSSASSQRERRSSWRGGRRGTAGLMARVFLALWAGTGTPPLCSRLPTSVRRRPRRQWTWSTSASRQR